jgi:uncharacterized protein DUF5683
LSAHLVSAQTSKPDSSDAQSMMRIDSTGQRLMIPSDSTRSKILQEMIDSNKVLSMQAMVDSNIVFEEAEMTKSTTGAIVRSLILPGWGQLYCENYFRAVLFFGGSAALWTGILWNNGKYNDFTDLYNGLDPDDPLRETYKTKREFYRDQRDQLAFYTFGVYLLAAVDAYVGAHLYDFDVSDDLSVGIMPNRFGLVSVGLSFSW